MIGESIGHYRIERTLGEGGMGIVYAARDEKLHRSVALKRIRAGIADPALRERFWREARAAASINHPGICQVHDVRDEGGELVIVMELLEGETLAERIMRGPTPLPETLTIGLAVLDALTALHKRGFVHRDLKPSNIFLLEDGRVKLLDFGLVLPFGGEQRPMAGGLTMTGMVMGSPRYMAPEQIRGGVVDGRADLFGLGAALHEALTGRPTFAGEAPVDIMFAVLHNEPTPLAGTPELDAAGRALTRALAKQPEKRYPDAESMAAELRRILPRREGTTTASLPIGAPTARLAVLPFRMLRPDPNLDFLATSLPDAIALSLAGLRSLVVRSTVATAKYADGPPDLAAIASSLDVGTVLTGTILPAGERCRVVAQLVEAPSGQVLWSLSSDVSGHDAFELQDTLSRKIVDALHVPLTTREKGALAKDTPASATAYELFLRANQHAVFGHDLTLAIDLYRKSIEVDPDYAPAWARLGRAWRLQGKYSSGRREDAYRQATESLNKALEINPDHPGAHHMFALLDLDLGRPEEAVERLLGVVARNPNDPEGYAGLVSAFRYVGMLDEAVEANRRAKALAPEMRTTVHHVYYARGEFDLAIEECKKYSETDISMFLAQAGRMDEARTILAEWQNLHGQGTLLGRWANAVLRALDGKPEAMHSVIDEFGDFPDPEGKYYTGVTISKLGLVDRGLELLEASMGRGYANMPLFRRDPWSTGIREHPRYIAALARAEEQHLRAVERFGGRF